MRRTLDRLDTARLRGARVRSRDFGDLYEMHQQPDVMKTLGGVRSAETTREYLRVNLEHWDRYGYGLWVLRTRDNDQLVGRCGIRHVDIEGEDEIELGYALMPAFWGRGIATEAATAMLDVALSRLKLSGLVAISLPDNIASRRVIEKCGGALERNVMRDRRPHVLYRFSRQSVNA